MQSVGLKSPLAAIKYSKIIICRYSFGALQIISRIEEQLTKKMHPGGLATLVNTSGWGISLDWTEEEQRTLESYMLRYPAERMDPLQRYVRIALALPRKNVRDIALRVRWTNMQAQLKRRTGLDPRGAPGMPPLPLPGPKPLMQMGPPLGGGPVHGGVGNTHMAPPAGPSAPSLPREAGPNTIEGPISYLLDANLAILNHFRSNMTAFKVHENTQLLVQFRDNILQILQAMESMGGVMGEMPPLPIRLNMELANSFLPSRPAGVLTYDGMMMPPPPQPALNAPGMVPLNGPGIGGGPSAPPPTAVGPQPPTQVPPVQQQPPPVLPPTAMGMPPGMPGSNNHHPLGGQPPPQQQQQSPQPGLVPQMRMGAPPMPQMAQAVPTSNQPAATVGAPQQVVPAPSPPPLPGGQPLAPTAPGKLEEQA